MDCKQISLEAVAQYRGIDLDSHLLEKLFQDNAKKLESQYALIIIVLLMIIWPNS